MVGIPQNPLVRSAIRTLWTDLMTVYVFDNVEDPETRRTTQVERPILQEVPCRLNYESLTVVSGEHLPRQAQSLEVYCDETLDIPPGSILEITHQGKTMRYKRSGLPAVYTNHQEIPVEPEDRYG